MERSIINTVLPFELGGKKVNYRDHFQLKLLQQYANTYCYKKLIDSFDKELIKLDGPALNNEFDSTSIKSLKKKYGKALYKVTHKYDKYDIRIFFYKRMIRDQKVRLEFHFCNDELFYYSYTFPYLTNKEKGEFLNNLADKYDLDHTHLRAKCIEDKNKVRLNLCDNLDLCLKYIDKKSPFLEYLDHHKIKNDKPVTKISKNFSNLSSLF